MHVIVYCPEGPDAGTVYLNRKLDDQETLNARRIAERVAASLGFELAKPTGHIHNNAGDIRVEFLDGEPNVVDERYQGSIRIWSGESYYFASEGQ